MHTNFTKERVNDSCWFYTTLCESLSYKKIAYQPDQNRVMNQQIRDDLDGRGGQNSIVSKQESGQPKSNLREFPTQIAGRNEIYEFED